MASTSGPSKSDIEAVFHRLRAQPTNKVLLQFETINESEESHCRLIETHDVINKTFLFFVADMFRL